MPTLQIQAQLSFDELFKMVEQLNPYELLMLRILILIKVI